MFAAPTPSRPRDRVTSRQEMELTTASNALLASGTDAPPAARRPLAAHRPDRRRGAAVDSGHIRQGVRAADGDHRPDRPEPHEHHAPGQLLRGPDAHLAGRRARAARACDLCAMEEAADTDRPAIFHCWNGLYDCAIPIAPKGEVLGYFLCGQILTDGARRRAVRPDGRGDRRRRRTPTSRPCATSG